LLPSPPMSPSVVDTSHTGSASELTCSIAVRLVFPTPLAVLVKPMTALLRPGARMFAVALTEKVTVTGVAPAVPAVAEADSQLGGPVIEKLAGVGELSW